MKYLITGDCNGIKYYARVMNYKAGYIPEFEWEGLQDNASRFKSSSLAEGIMKDINGASKIPMKVVGVKE